MREASRTTPDTVDAIDGQVLHAMVREDQLLAVRRSMLVSLPVNAVLGLTGMFVAIHAGLGRAGILWFLLSSAVNAGRAFLCRVDYRRSVSADHGPVKPMQYQAKVEQHLKLAQAGALLSGLVWALVPLLCAGYTSPQTMFYLTVVAGVTAGAVTYGAAFSPVPIAFITPPLLSAAGCLFYAGDFDRTSLACVVLLYLAAMVRAARLGEDNFREFSRIKNEATAMASSLRNAHAYEQELAREMHHRALHDALTGLFNREGFMHAATPLLARRDEVPLCLLMIDLDGFKAINDVFGHKAGDRVLVEVGNLLKRELDSMAAVTGRWGGDEFAVLYHVRGQADEPEAVAGRLITAIAASASRQRGRLGASIGIYLGQDIPIEDMIVYADAALYQAKRSGRNQCHVFDETLRQRLIVRRDIERDLPAAIAEKDIQMWYQPIVDPTDRRLDSVEALLRWHHPSHGWLPPEDVIFIAANTGLSDSLLRTILAHICRAEVVLRASGLRNVRVAMNVSPREMSRLPITDIVKDVLGEHGIPPSVLEIEITEETALDVDAVQMKIASLAASGIRITVDDFGVGYSSLSSLRGEHVHRVKIDRSFIRGLASSQESKVLVEAILNLGRSLGLEVVAEGVENEEDMQALRALGCSLVQGFHIGRPMPLDALMRWMTPEPHHAENH